MDRFDEIDEYDGDILLNQQIYDVDFEIGRCHVEKSGGDYVLMSKAIYDNLYGLVSALISDPQMALAAIHRRDSDEGVYTEEDIDRIRAAI